MLTDVSSETPFFSTQQTLFVSLNLFIQSNREQTAAEC